MNVRRRHDCDDDRSDPEPPSMMFFGGWAQFKDSKGNIFGLHSPVPAEAAQTVS